MGNSALDQSHVSESERQIIALLERGVIALETLAWLNWRDDEPATQGSGPLNFPCSMTGDGS